MFGFALLDRFKPQTYQITLLRSYLMPPLGLPREMSGGPYTRFSSVWLHQYALDEGRTYSSLWRWDPSVMISGLADPIQHIIPHFL
jgi:hypothetical protein